MQCPMFTIQDAPDAAPIEAWIRRAIDKPLDDLVLMTGEGLRRIMKLARRARPRPGLRRGARPGRGNSRAARSPAGRCARSGSRRSRPRRSRPREGVIEMLGRLDLEGTPPRTFSFIRTRITASLTGASSAQGAEVDTVLPYVYDSKAADANIVTAHRRHGGGTNRCRSR